MASLKFENVTKIYTNSVKAVNNANLNIKDKEFIVLVGPSGCGKSTLLRMIAGLEDISDGSIFIGDNKVNKVPPKDRNIAMVFQNYALYPHLTVFDNMAFGLKLRKYPKTEINKRVKEAADLLELNELLDRKPKALSGGQRQRVAVGRAIVRKPEVFLFDEPLSNLDAKLRVQMRLEITKLHQRLQTTVVYVTHDQVEAMTMGSRIVVLKDGIIQQVDSPINIYNKPANLFVAGFIGSPAMNFIYGKFDSHNGLNFITDDFKIQFPLELKKRLTKYQNEKIVVGIRPEHLIVNAQSGFSTAMIEAEVEVVEHMGHETYLYLAAGDKKIVCRQNSEFNIKTNSSVILSLDLEKLHFFNAETGMVI